MTNQKILNWPKKTKSYSLAVFHGHLTYTNFPLVVLKKYKYEMQLQLQFKPNPLKSDIETQCYFKLWQKM